MVWKQERRIMLFRWKSSRVASLQQKFTLGLEATLQVGNECHWIWQMRVHVQDRDMIILLVMSFHIEERDVQAMFGRILLFVQIGFDTLYNDHPSTKPAERNHQLAVPTSDVEPCAIR